MTSSSSLAFMVQRSEPVLIPPAKPTPYEIKNLSDIDDQKGLRFHVPIVLIYRNAMGMEGKDPVKIIRAAIAEALVYYYPFAGRLKEGPNHKLMVECTGEGLMFIEANAHVRLEEFGDALKPPFPCMQDLLYDAPGSSGILDCPLLLIQVTRLMCRGFIVAIRMNHTMCDGPGIIQFMNAVAEMARGAHVPSVVPVWKRELLSARNPPIVSCVHHFYEEFQDSQAKPPSEEPTLVSRTFIFDPQEIAVLRNQLPVHLRRCSRFEILIACLWRCRTIALNYKLDHEVRVAFTVTARSIYNPPLPVGYYGNAFGFAAAVATAGKLCESPLGYALELVRKAKSDVTDEFMRSSADLLVKRGRPLYTPDRTFIVSDVTRLGFRDINFGWGEAAFGGPISGFPWELSFFVSSKNKKGAEEIVVTITLPVEAMEKFVGELDRVMKQGAGSNKLSFLVSPL